MAWVIASHFYSQFNIGDKNSLQEVYDTVNLCIALPYKDTTDYKFIDCEYLVFNTLRLTVHFKCVDILWREIRHISEPLYYSAH